MSFLTTKFRLQTSLQYGGVKDLTDEDLEHIIVEASGAELNSKASSAFQATVSLAADYLWEKLQDQLRDIANDLLAEILHEEQQKQEEEYHDLLCTAHVYLGNLLPKRRTLHGKRAVLSHLVISQFLHQRPRNVR